MTTLYDDYSLQSQTTFGVPARCKLFLDYDNPRGDLPFFKDQGVFDDEEPYVCLGGGSNMLFTKDFKGTVLRNCERWFDVPEPDAEGTTVLTVGAGVVVDELIGELCARGVWGMAQLSAIPGTIGGAVVQNIGAYGVEISSVIDSVEVYDTRADAFRTLSREECRFGYRSSLFKTPEGAGLIVVSATLRMPRCCNISAGYDRYRDMAGQIVGSGADAPTLTPMMVRRVIRHIRAMKLPDPSVVGSAGSFFKNPEVPREVALSLMEDYPKMPAYPLADGRVKLSAAWLIDQCGLKGRTVGGASVWPLQPLVLSAPTKQATASDVLALKDLVIKSVHGRFGITLVPEVVIV